MGQIIVLENSVHALDYKGKYRLTVASVRFTGIKKPRAQARGSRFEAWQCPTLTWGGPTLPSALKRFTTEFGMDQVVPLRYGRQAKTVTISTKLTLTLCHSTSFGKSSNLCPLHTPKHLRCCMVKPHGQLVRVSSTHYYASTPRLSTSSSPTAL